MSDNTKRRPKKKVDLIDQLHKQTGLSHATLFYMIKLGIKF